MTDLFLKIINMSISAGALVLAILALRLAMKRCPRWVHVLLWGMVAIRLMVPVALESPMSLVRMEQVQESADDILYAYVGPGNFYWDDTQEYQIALQSGIDPIYAGDGRYYVATGQTPEQEITIIADQLAWVWVLGMAAMAVYTAVSCVSLGLRLRTATRLRGSIFRSEAVSSPFVFGILRPRIYLPYNLSSRDREYVVAHEQAHIRRLDHWWKPLGFLLLTVYWFNPLMWVAYILLCRDIELACDEKVIAQLGIQQRADYSQALLSCSVGRRTIAACPLAFGEVGVKDRVRSILNYRKPGFWLIAAALGLCAVVAVCFLTDPNPDREFSMEGTNVSDLDPEGIVQRILDIEDWDTSNVHVNADNFSLTVDADFNWMDSQAVRYFFGNSRTTYSAQLRIFPEKGKYFLTEPDEWVEQDRIFLLRHYLDAIKYLPQKAIRQMAPADRYLIVFVDGGMPAAYERVITYSAQGAGKIDGWYIHLQLHPLHADGEGYSGTGDEWIEVFYGEAGDGESTADMQPTALNLRGFQADYLFAPFGGATYRYTLSNEASSLVTADELLLTFGEDTGSGWEVYSLKEYPDGRKVLAISDTQEARLYEYAPPRRAADGALAAARAAGYVIEENGTLTGGQDKWHEFYEKTLRGEPAVIQVAHYYTLDPARTAPSTYEAYKQDYPALYIDELTYDGKRFILRPASGEHIRSYEYLMKYEDQSVTRYVLTHDQTHSWEEIWAGLVSSALGAGIDHYTICTE